MKSYIRAVLEEMRLHKLYAAVGLAFLILSYSCYLVFDEETINTLGREDGFFESSTAIFFFLTFLFFLIIFIRKKQPVCLVLALVFFLGAGEEISWGQRIFHIRPPEYFQSKNVQHELNIHNLEIFNTNKLNGTQARGFSLLLTFNFAYKLFWLGFGVILPLLVLGSRFIKKAAHVIRLPVPPLSVGLLFPVNWLIYRLAHSYLLPEGKAPLYYFTIYEMHEYGSAFLFMLLSVYFLAQATKKPAPGPLPLAE